MKKPAEKTQEGEKVAPESIQEVMKAIEEFCSKAKNSHKRDSNIRIVYATGQDASDSTTSGNGFGCIAAHIQNIKLPYFSKKEFILAEEAFLAKDRTNPDKYSIELGYLRELEAFSKKDLKMYTNSSILELAKNSNFSSYVALKYNKPDGTPILLTLVEYDECVYLCYDDTWIFYHSGDKIISNPEHQTTGNGLTPELYMQKYKGLRKMIQKEVSKSRQEKNKSSEIAAILKSLQF